jgi:gamma-glutamyltranspeptidase
MLIEQVSGLRLTQADFAAHRGEWVQPYNTTYHLRNMNYPDRNSELAEISLRC